MRMILFLFLIYLFTLKTLAFAVETDGHFSLGIITVKENNAVKYDGETDNDRLNFSSTLSYQIKKITNDKDSFHLNIRNKLNPYNSYNYSAQTYSGKNYLQVRELYYSSPLLLKNASIQVGRFSDHRLYGQYTDGAAFSYKTNQFLTFEIFGGLDPQTNSTQVELKFDNKSIIYGTIVEYNRSHSSFKLNSSTSLYFKSPKNLEKQTYLYHSTFLNPSWGNYITMDFLLLLKPKSIINSGRLSYRLKRNRLLNLNVGIFRYDPNEYELNREIRDVLVSSNYYEIYGNNRFRLTTNNYLNLKLSYGKRQRDQIKKESVGVEYMKRRFLSKYSTLNFELGYQNRFNKKGPYTKFGLDYIKDDYDTSFYAKYVIEQTGNISLNPITIGTQGTYYFSKVLLMSGMFEFALQKDVKIFNSLLDVSYRFHSKKKKKKRYGNTQ